MAPMRVAYLINQYPKVSHSFIRREIQALERQGLEILRISIRGWNELLVDPEDLNERNRTRYVLRDGILALIPATLRLALAHPINFVQTLSLAIRMSRRSDRPLPVHLIYLAEACQMLKWLKRDKVDHLHAHFGTNSTEVAMLAHALGGPLWSFTVHGPEEFDKPLAIGLPEKIKRANFVVAISSYGRSQLYRWTGYPDWGKIHVVRCGLDRKFLDGIPKQSPSPRRLVCVGRICEQKGQLLLLEAARLLAAKGVDFELVLAGDGEMRSEAEQFIKDNSLTAKIRITGWISGEQVREEILSSRALVLPSFAEGLPVVIMEAMALRKPVISTFVAGIPELVRSGEHGWLIPAGNTHELVNAMENCLSLDLDQTLQMGNSAKLQVEHLHQSDLESAKLNDLFKSSFRTRTLPEQDFPETRDGPEHSSTLDH